jgi:hypothetical protein
VAGRRRKRESRDESRQALLTASNAVTAAVIDAVGDSEGRVHSESAIAAITATAGTLLLRQALGAQLDGLEPGSVVFVDEINEQGTTLLGYAMKVAADLGIRWDTSGHAVPDEHRPHEREVDLVRRVEPAVARVLGALNVDRSAWPSCCILSAVDLVLRTQDVLDPRIATSLITSALVAGSKTVPYPST